MRLSNQTMSALPHSVQRPSYDRTKVTNGIVHLGIGAFHRAHQAMMTDAVLNDGELNWGIVGASLRSAETRDALMPQDGLYTVMVRDENFEKLQVIGAVSRIVVAPENPEALLEVMSSALTKIIMLTITEKGYCHDPATGQLNEMHPAIVHDLAHPQRPKSAAGFIVEALKRRKAAGLMPFTVLSCDNLPANGKVIKRVLSRLAYLHDAGFGAWVDDVLACPCSMVDRIVPATTDNDRASISASLGLSDAWPVVTEPFCQWVIEDDFPLGRPQWEKAGADFTHNVAPYELMKLRMLNGAHSSLAYLGYLKGYDFVFEASNHAFFINFLQKLWAEIIPTVPAPEGVDLATYAQHLLERFQNPTIKHRLWQIAMDGSQKLPQRLLCTIADNLKANRPIDNLSLGVAGFAVYASGRDLKGKTIDVRDPLAAELAQRLEDVHTNPKEAILRFLNLTSVFGAELPHNAQFRNSLTQAVEALLSGG